MNETLKQINKLADDAKTFGDTIERLLGEIDEMDAELDATLKRLNNERYSTQANCP